MYSLVTKSDSSFRLASESFRRKSSFRSCLISTTFRKKRLVFVPGSSLSLKKVPLTGSRIGVFGDRNVPEDSHRQTGRMHNRIEKGRDKWHPAGIDGHLP